MSDTKREFANKPCEIEISNCQTVTPKLLPSQNMNCPWISRAPFSSPIDLRIENTTANYKRKLSMDPPCEKIPCVAVQHSSNLFLHFLRLMQIFPEIHPATLHTTMVLCKNNFFCAVDKLLYAKKYITNDVGDQQTEQKVEKPQPHTNKSLNTKGAYLEISFPKAIVVRTLDDGVKPVDSSSTQNRKLRILQQGPAGEFTGEDISKSSTIDVPFVASSSTSSTCSTMGDN
ncbi:hypothetical protein PPYR_04821 [Photinus pyralis]|uniref:Uncharacterized protein n=2 Tax=Photinus pyralis TaxID=7054 RepID=A0A5N4AZ64_PHOPY|nr:uncharacterized protein LOC116163106 [Photinus pyralis]KAB0802635.1 hypothetical protein PPYR_04821 [Photinus pyralis]